MIPMSDHSSSRRRFLGTITAVVGTGLLSRLAAASPRERTDQEIIEEVIAFAKAKSLAGKPIDQVMAAVGLFFLKTPYVAHTLEEPGEEHLVVNLRGFDCLTFVENTLVLSRCIASGRMGFDDFRAELTRVRYRSGIMKGYPSRLHYFTDWIADNASKGIVRDITMECGGKKYRKTLDFMTTHRSSYAQLSTETYVQEITAIEKRLSAGQLQMISREDVGKALVTLHNGDIIGTTTSMEGMDVSHTGMVVLENGTPRFLHASLSGKEVMIADGSLADYVASVKRHTGIVVARPLELNR
jgi:hypothetical protein